jgi:hypothetical protein
LLQLDLTVAFPLIDVLLGGKGSSSVPERQLMEIEEQILETGRGKSFCLMPISMGRAREGRKAGLTKRLRITRIKVF